MNYSPSANLYVTASKDGSIKLWDGVSNKCVNTFERAHDGSQVCSVVFSRNAKVRRQYHQLLSAVANVTVVVRDCDGETFSPTQCGLGN